MKQYLNGLVRVALFAAVTALAPAAHAQFAYVAGQVSISGTGGPTSQGRLGLYSFADGSVSYIGNTTASGTSVTLTGLALATNGTLYGSSYNSATGSGFLYQVNQSTGALTQLGSGFTFGGNANDPQTLSSITFGSDGTLYGLVTGDSGTARLARFASLSGTPTSSISNLTPSFISNGGLTADTSGNLYASQGEYSNADLSSSVFRITPAGNTSTTLPGDPGYSGYSVFALSYYNGELIAFDSAGATGPGGEPTEGGVYRINTTTGENTGFDVYDATVVGSFNAASGVIAPEPSSVALFAPLGIVCFVAHRRKRSLCPKSL